MCVVVVVMGVDVDCCVINVVCVVLRVWLLLVMLLLYMRHVAW